MKTEYSFDNETWYDAPDGKAFVPGIGEILLRMTNETTASQPKSIGDDALWTRTEHIRLRFANPTSIHRSTLLHYAECLLAHLAILRAPAAQASATIQAAPELVQASRKLIHHLDARGEKPVEFTYSDPLILAMRLALVTIESAATIPEPVMVAEPVGETQSITINGRQLQDALDAAWPDREDVDQGDTELTMFVRPEDGVDSEGNAQPRGLWFYWTEYPEEGVSWLNPESEMPPLVQLGDSTTLAAPMVADPAGVAVQNLELVIARLEQIAGNFTDDYRNAAEEALVCARSLAATIKAVPSEALDPTQGEK